MRRAPSSLSGQRRIARGEGSKKSNSKKSKMKEQEDEGERQEDERQRDFHHRAMTRATLSLILNFRLPAFALPEGATFTASA
jgi:hypothetical protein